MPIVLPPRDVRESFHQIVQPMLTRMKGSLGENRTLAETRDYLLPRLMSGAVRVAPQAEAV